MAEGRGVACGDSIDQNRPTFTLRAFNRKVPTSSRDMLPSDGWHYRCPWIEDSVTIHSDGNVSCGLDDPHSQRSFGNAKSQYLKDIFDNPEYRRLQKKLWDGYRCSDCTLYQRELVDFSEGARDRPLLPSVLIIEPTVKCNIRCLNGNACAPNNSASIRTRDSDMMSFDVFAGVIDQLRDSLRDIYFFNYGDPFVHAQAEDMLHYLREACPSVRVVTSTNGIPLWKPDRADRVVSSGLNHITFTIGGVTQESYGRYHVGGRVEQALRGLENVTEAKRRLKTITPHVVWRYLLFRWNDSVQEVDEAIRLSKSYGVDDFVLYLTHVPSEGISYRFAPGSLNYHRYRSIIDCAYNFTRAGGAIEPDDLGFFEREDVADLGPARWTGWRACLPVPASGEWLHLSLATNRPSSVDTDYHTFIVTPWRVYKIPILFKRWNDLSISIPPGHMGGGMYYIITIDCWFPIDEFRTIDTRCLGVLLQDEKSITDAEVASRAAMTDDLTSATVEEREMIEGLGFTVAVPLRDGNAGRYQF